MITCVIVDDEEHAIDVLKHHVSQCTNLSLRAVTSDPHEAINLVSAGGIDLLFLDVHMPRLSGIEVAEIIAGKCSVIFTTAYPEYALNGYELGVEDFLLKPISYPRFLKAVNKTAEKIAARRNGQGHSEDVNREAIYVKTGLKNNVVKINLEDVTYIESLQNYVGIFGNGKKILAYLSMKELEETLPRKAFIRVHKSYIISLAHIAKVEGSEVVLDEGTRIDISDSYRSKFWDVIRKQTLG